METSFYSLPIQSTEVWHERRKQFNLHKTNAVNEELASSLRDGREVQGIGGSTNCSFHSNSLSNKIAIDKLAKLIYILIVVGIGKDKTADCMKPAKCRPTAHLLEQEIGKDRIADHAIFHTKHKNL